MSDLLEKFEEEIDDCCDLDNGKTCDNCGKCIESDKEFNSIQITKIIVDKNTI